LSEPMSEKEIYEKLLEIVKTEEPETVEKLIELANHRLGFVTDTTLKYVIDLENQGRLRLSHPPGSIPTEFNAYLLSSHAAWFWIIIALSLSTTISVFTIPENATPYVYIRYVLGSVFVLLLPGYSLIKTLFPTREIDNIERTALSIGMSLALVPLVGLLLNYTPWGIRLTPVTLSLLSLTTILTITGLQREYAQKTKKTQE
jgi:hypothetical protein